MRQNSEFRNNSGGVDGIRSRLRRRIARKGSGETVAALPPASLPAKSKHADIRSRADARPIEATIADAPADPSPPLTLAMLRRKLDAAILAEAWEALKAIRERMTEVERETAGNVVALPVKRGAVGLAMLVGLLLFGACLLAIGAMAHENREKMRLQVALDAERAAHAATTAEINRLRGERENLLNEVAELRALRGGGPFRGS